MRMEIIGRVSWSFTDMVHVTYLCKYIGMAHVIHTSVFAGEKNYLFHD